MAKVTQTFKTGMTVLTGGNVPAYTLEYLAPARRKNTGDFETIVIPYIEIGRAGNCNVQYGDESSTVSRRHAAIERRGSEFYLIHLSQTNPSLLNGNPVPDEASLNNGDEIQLSMEGPKLRFNTTPSGTAKMGYTKKINLLIKQSAKQYQRAMISLIIVLVVVCLAGGWFIYSQNKQIKNIRAANEQIKQQRKQDSLSYIMESQKNAQVIASLARSNKALERKTEEQSETIRKINDDLQFENKMYRSLKDNIYFLEVTEVFVTKPNGESGVFDMSWTGTAFLCDDGKLVTARHCIQGWRYGVDENSNFINYCELNGGRIAVKYKVTSSKDWFEFNYRDVVLDDTRDIDYQVNETIEDGTTWQYDLKFAIEFSSDWAYVDVNRSSNISYDKKLSKNLEAGDKIYILGFSFGMGGPGLNQVNPLYSESNVAQSGLSEEGLILITDRNFEHGNSGGPVFVKVEDSVKCIGIVSNATINPITGETSSIGGIVPIGNMK